ncbi:hypothetical protein GLOIN_2v1770262 [Rhizophagus irregularis DAOM 181602=DAOM 197198]|uniref:F-box domain-containing protein n=2 Tax=Rhizophagus irregularis TaxID=588596 RepID=A0A2P4QCN0_RHIID|nr:hypothetical protein GLOIN_2v1770262 [Rhizophagus irregularis DAOM 181602=DAOM 197198]POG75387.1 hypothetical protein GLOIN_2v1770262 [Rhizophagus irregularis DAOM 181602=DAOM 197198]|eukprot:XP_025182253.1 hypothetical protein GLOIN_2v1770262 [Rhizophagus irregularis DAOM 181602=DAOM 197198]
MVDVIAKVIEDFSARDLHSALLVNREWCRATVPMYWKAPFSFTMKRSTTALKVYESFLETAEKSTQQTVQKPFFDYPLFIKELNYTNLLACLKMYEMAKKVEAILQMLTKYEIRLKTFIIDNTGANNERSHLDIHLHDTSVPRAEESINHLKELLSAQTRPLNLRLVFPSGSGRSLLETFQSRLESFKRLELVKWNFNGCDWEWLKRCSNLVEFAITSPSPQVSEILGTKNESYRLKVSKNSKILTEHWHFNKNDEIPLKFYFHLDKSLMESQSLIITQPRVSRRTNDPKKLQYICANAMIKMFKELDYYFSEDEDNYLSTYDDYDDGYDESLGISYESYLDSQFGWVAGMYPEFLQAFANSSIPYFGTFPHAFCTYHSVRPRHFLGADNEDGIEAILSACKGHSLHEIIDGNKPLHPVIDFDLPKDILDTITPKLLDNQIKTHLFIFQLSA